MIEDLEAKWVEDEHLLPLSAAVGRWIGSRERGVPEALMHPMHATM